jgi:hypothetical protein
MYIGWGAMFQVESDIKKKERDWIEARAFRLRGCQIPCLGESGKSGYRPTTLRKVEIGLRWFNSILLGLCTEKDEFYVVTSDLCRLIVLPHVQRTVKIVFLNEEQSTFLKIASYIIKAQI